MDSNSVHKKITALAAKRQYISFQEMRVLKTSSRTHKMSIRWMTEGSADGSGKPPHMTQHLLWWDSAEYVGGNAGGSATKELQDQLNLQTTNREWRTLSYENIDMVSFKGKLYKIK